MRCGHCDATISKAEPPKICPYRNQNPTDHAHAVCLSCFERMTMPVHPDVLAESIKKRTAREVEEFGAYIAARRFSTRGSIVLSWLRLGDSYSQPGHGPGILGLHTTNFEQ